MPLDKLIKILFVVNDSWFFKSHRLPIANAAISDGNEVYLAAARDDTTTSIELDGVMFRKWDIAPRSRNPFREIIAFFSLSSIVREVNPDLIHLVTIKPVLYGGLISRLLSIRSVVFAISGRGQIYSSGAVISRLLKPITTLMYRFSLSHKNSIVVVQNSSDQEYFTDQKLIPADRLRLIPGSGVDLIRYNIGETSSHLPLPVILFASRMLRDKGVEEFVGAAKVVNKNGIHAEFIVAGTVDADNPNAVSRAWLEQLPGEKGIKWIGHCAQIEKLLSDSSIVVLPSRYGEGVPKILIEAAAMGKPIVTTNWPGCKDAVKHEYNGLLVEPGDVQVLASSIERLILDPILRKKFGINGRRLAEKYFSIEEVIQTTLGIYRELDSNTD